MNEIKQVKKQVINKKVLLTIVFIVFILGLLFGSIYITILDNSNKKIVIDNVKNYFGNFSSITFKDKLGIFKNSLIKNLSYYLSIWILGLSIIGIPVILIMVFFKSFITGFSISGLFAVYKFKGLLGIFFYMIPSNIITLLYTLFLGAYSIDLSIKLLRHAFKKKTLNFGFFMGKYYFLLLVSILLSVIVSLYDAFIEPSILNLFTKIIK
ncbi:MAG: stage II sporulation protein M [Bacilli bacterium]|nr:stage II sporulation protein M [Bacilli bacterium]